MGRGSDNSNNIIYYEDYNTCQHVAKISSISKKTYIYLESIKVCTKKSVEGIKFYSVYLNFDIK